MRRLLFLCTGNSARSILAEAYLNHKEAGWRAYSAGSQPTGRVNPLALATLAAHGIDPGAPTSKSWDAFAGAGAPAMDLVVTVCDSAAGETCPIWPGAPRAAHWGFADPAAAQGPEEARRAAFETAFHEISARIDLFLAEEGAA